MHPSFEIVAGKSYMVKARLAGSVSSLERVEALYVLADGVSWTLRHLGTGALMLRARDQIYADVERIQ